MTNKRTGAKFEREVQQYLKERGVCIRVGGSGTGKINICDLIYVSGGKTFLIECKTVFGDKFYPYERELLQFRELKERATKAGAMPLLLLKFKQKLGRKRKIVFIDLRDYDFQAIPYDSLPDKSTFLIEEF